MSERNPNSSLRKQHSRFLCSLSNTTIVSKQKDAIKLIEINSFRLEKNLNNALHRSGIYTMNVVIFGIEEAVDNLGSVVFLIPFFFVLFP